MTTLRDIELLAPASSLEGGLVALSAGADAVYVGAPQYGARSAAGVSLEDIRQLCEAAHAYAARVYVALNTILTDSQLTHAVELAHQLYEAGADALIMQDLGLLTQELPPIPLHASTQCHNHSLEQLQMLSDLGFEQAVLPREWSCQDIAAVRDKTPLRLEAFVHGALCVSYSGRCFISEALSQRSANRGQCAQYCRMTYDLVDAQGQKLRQGEHLLSLKDLNRTEIIEEMIDAGVSSFKVEGRLKAIPYVRNVIAHYRRVLDEILTRRSDELRRPSWGAVEYTFTPQPEATFARPFTTYNTPLGSPIPTDSITPYSSKSLGQPIGTVIQSRGKELEIALLSDDITLANGDGVVAYAIDKKLIGAQINQETPARRAGHYRLRLSQALELPQGATLWRNLNHLLEAQLLRPDASTRTIPVSLHLEAMPDRLALQMQLTEASDLSVTRSRSVTLEPAQRDNTAHVERTLRKLGDTPYRATEVTIKLDGLFVPPSIVAELRRELAEELQRQCLALALQCRDAIGKPLQQKRIDRLRTSDPTARQRYGLPDTLDFTYNVANESARQLYRQLGVSGSIAPALEVERPEGAIPVMFTRHCLLHQLGYCTRTGRKPPFALPLYLVRGRDRLRVENDCRHCMMTLWLDPSPLTNF